MALQLSSDIAPEAVVVEDTHRWSVLGLLCLAVMLSLTTWFSATAITPELKAAWQLSGTIEAWLTNGVQIGFVVGALVSSLVNLPDVVRLNRLMAVSALLAAAANACLLLQPGPVGLVAARILTGVALAGVYPPALKLVSTWFIRGRGVALGAVIGALTLGSSLPHLFRALAGTLDWQLVVATASVTTLIGSGIFWFFASEGPHPFGKAVFDPRQIGAIVRDRPLVLVNIGYLGHMWELYAMWAWLLAYTRAALETQQQASPFLASLLTFCAIAAGVGGCLLGGVLSDAGGDRAERQQRRQERGGLLLCLEGRAGIGQQPGPHGIEFPHVAEIADVDQHQRPVAEDRADLAWIEHRLAERMRAFAGKEPEERGSNEGRDACGQHDRLPVERTGECPEQMRQRRAQCQRPYNGAERHSPAPYEPRRDQLQRRRINAGQRYAGEDAGGDEADRSGLQQQARVGGGGKQGRDRHQPVQPDDIRQVDEA